jgi:hypothetical protein
LVPAAATLKCGNIGGCATHLVPPMNFKPRCRSRVVSLISCAAMLLVAGCGAVNELRVDDKSTPIVSARVLHRFDGGRGGVELDYGSVRATGSQQLPEFSTVTLGNNSIKGPASLQNTARMQHLQLLYNHLLFKDQPIELEWFAGVAAVNVAWNSSSANPADPPLKRTDTWYGPAGGVLGRVKLGAGFALEARYSAAAEPRLLGGGRAGAELALAFSPAPALQLRAGIADSRMDVEERPSGLESKLSLRARGPFLGLVVAF